MENSMEATEKIKNKITTWSRNPTSGYISKIIEISILKSYLYSHVNCSIIYWYNSQDMELQPKCLLTDEWMKKMWYLHTIKYYSALKKKEILLYTTTWMDFEDIMLSEISQSQKDKYCIITLKRGA